jgi:hypothetical protein
VLVTDAGASDEMVEAFTRKQIRVIQV